LVKRPSYGGEGPALNHYDAGALGRWLDAAVRPLLDAAPGLVEGVGCDSLEVYHSNWTADMPREFEKRRGYDLLPRLPELYDDAAAAGRGLRFDFWRTLSELTEERFTRTLGDWCRRRGLELEMEPYGTPPNPMTAAAHISIPTGEHYEWKGFAVQRCVASMAHISGRRVVGAEAWTWAGLPNRLADSLSDIKLVSDMTFLLGANDLTGVDFPYSPESAGSPGWMPYYGPVMGAASPQWKFFPALVAYLNRCQWMLRQGEPMRKVAVYLPVEDAFSAGPVDQMLLDFAVRDRLATGHPTSEFGLRNGLKHHSDLIHGLIRAGYDFDGLDFWAVTRLGRAGGGRLEVGPAVYEAIILPALEIMEAGAMERIAAFCRTGGTVVASGRLPATTAGLGRNGENARLRRLLAEVFGDNPLAGRPHACGRGRGIFVAAAGDAAGTLSGFVTPSVKMTPKPETVGFAHRHVGDRDVYFFANVGPDDVRFSAEFIGQPRRIETWDAMDSKIRLAAASGSRLELAIPARGSIFVVAGGATADAEPLETARDAAASSRGEVAAAAKAAITNVDRVTLGPEWSLSFEGPDAPPPAKLQSLISWTELRGGKYFSGTGIYRASFDWAKPLPGRCVLRFGLVREAAEVKLNGRWLGIIFNPPWAVELGPALRQGRNDIEITVVNLPLNRFLGLPDEDLGPLRARFGGRFSAPEEKKVAGGPAPSGLIGAVWLEVRRPD
ncbi:MAG: glycosyl hydrolase, partial [Candidatus Aminicenantales bacterium]